MGEKRHVNMYDDLHVRYASPTPGDDESEGGRGDDGGGTEGTSPTSEVQQQLSLTNNRICQACRKKLDTPPDLNPRIWFPKYFCGYCHRKLQHKHSLWIHLFHHTAAMQRPPYTCPLCQKVFDTLSGYKLHLGSLHSVKPSNDCPFCPKKFIDRKTFEAHLALHQSEGGAGNAQVSCSSVQHLLEFHRSMVCSDCFSRLQHMCTSCREMFNRKEELRQHQMDVHFHCPVCNSIFVKKTSVLQHLRKCHEDAVPTSCDVCRGTTTEDNLCGTGGVPIKLDSTTADDGSLDIPEKPAEKGRAYKCVTCNAYFWDEAGEAEATVSSCRVCVQQRKPKRQKTDVRERRFECGECSQKLGSLEEVTSHVRTHAKRPADGGVEEEDETEAQRPKCNVCLRIFATEESLAQHIRLSHHYCTYCLQAFHEKSHVVLHVMANHGEQNPIVCQACKQLYVTVYQTDPNEPLRQAEGIQFIFKPVEENVDMEEGVTANA